MTLKAYKEAAKVGTRMRVLEHWVPRYHGSERIVTKVQNNGYWFDVVDPATGQIMDTRHWAEFPKASQMTFDGRILHVRLDERRFWKTEILESPKAGSST
jgi:hypothetical protein